MSTVYENVVAGKLKLKGKALDVKGGYGGGVFKKKQKHKRSLLHFSQSATGGNNLLSSVNAETIAEAKQVKETRNPSAYNDHLTPAERRYLEQTQKIELERLAKMASKSHRDRIQEFNQYLANLTEHYDIPKVGPG